MGKVVIGLKSVDLEKLGPKSFGKIFEANDSDFDFIDLELPKPKPKIESFNFMVNSDLNPEVLKTLFGDPSNKPDRVYKITSKEGVVVEVHSDQKPTVQYKKIKLFRGKQYARPFVYFEWVDLPEGNPLDLFLMGIDNERRINIVAKK